MVTATGTEAWRVLSFSDDLGILLTNPESPEGGAFPTLDYIGFEREIPRSPGESDDAYRLRIAAIPDTVSPNAIRRAANRVLAPYGVTACFREVGDVPALFPGMFCDVSSQSRQYAYAYDLDATLFAITTTGFEEDEIVRQVDGDGRVATGRIAFLSGGSFWLVQISGTFVVGFPIVGLSSGATATPTVVQFGLAVTDRFKLDMDYTEFRAFFMIGVPPMDVGEFGIPYDSPAGAYPNAFDLTGPVYLDFLDGFPVTTAILYRAIWQSMNHVRAGGVGFELYKESIGCV
jgi:hypothetical protein